MNILMNEKFNETLLPKNEEFYSKCGGYYRFKLKSCKEFAKILK